MRWCASQICEEIGVKCPVNVKMFTGKSKLLLIIAEIFDFQLLNMQEKYSIGCGCCYVS